MKAIKKIVQNLKTWTGRLILLLVIWQFFSVIMVVIFNWPAWISWVNLSLLSVWVLFLDIFDSFLLLIASIPFYIILPNPYFETLSMWRILFAWLFAVWFIRDLKFNFRNLKFLPYDKILGIFTALALIITLSFARFIGQGIKEILFWLNVYLFYLVLVNAIKTRAQIIRTVKYTAGSLLLIVGLGFVQLATTFFVNLDVFWVYWASFASKVYYGQYFGEIALYSNSWFSYDGARQLRLFSVLPDSHAFALIAMFALAFLLPLLVLNKKSKKIVSSLWKNIILSSLAIALTATRAVWIGIAGPIFSAAVLFIRNIQREFLKKIFTVFALVVVLAALLPVINLGFEFIRTGRPDGEFGSRAFSIYDLENSSNLGRLQIWKESLNVALAKPFGVGLGNFVIGVYGAGDSMTYEDIISQKNEDFNLPFEFVTAHSLYLQILVELGFLSLIIFVMFILKYFKDVWVFVKKYKEKNDFLVVLVLQLGLALCWVFTSALFDVTLFNDRVLIYFFIALGLSGMIIKNYEILK